MLYFGASFLLAIIFGYFCIGEERKQRFRIGSKHCWEC